MLPVDSQILPPLYPLQTQLLVACSQYGLPKRYTNTMLTSHHYFWRSRAANKFHIFLIEVRALILWPHWTILPSARSSLAICLSRDPCGLACCQLASLPCLRWKRLLVAHVTSTRKRWLFVTCPREPAQGSHLQSKMDKTERDPTN